MTKGSKLIRPAKVVIRFGEPFNVSYDGDPDKIPREVLERESFRIMERIEELLPEHMKPDAAEKASWYGELVQELPSSEPGPEVSAGAASSPSSEKS